MKLHRKLILLPASALLIAAGPSTQSGTRQANCVIDVWSKINFNEVDSTRAIIQNLGPTAHEILGIAPEALQEYINIQPVNHPGFGGADFPDTGQTRVTVILTLDEKAQPAAREFLDKMIQSLPGEIDHLQRGQYEEQLGRIKEARVAQATEENRVRNAQDELRSMGMGNRSTADIRALAKSLDEQNQNLNLDVAALTAQGSVLNDTVDKMNAEAAKKAADDPVAKELETIVTVKQKKLEMLQGAYKTGQVSSSEMADAEAAAAEARVQLLERRESVAHAAGGDALADFQKQLVTVQVSLAQDKARLDAIDKQSAVLNKALEINQAAGASGRGGISSGGFGGGGSRPGDISDTAIQNIQRQLEAIPKAAVRVVSESAS